MCNDISYIIRDVCEEDIVELVELLNSLSPSLSTSYDKLIQAFNERQSLGIITKVAESTSCKMLIGTASMFIEPKYTHEGMYVGHIEDVVIREEFRNRGIARSLINTLVNIAVDKKCYKTILDCDKDNTTFYKKCGFVECELQMRKNLDTDTNEETAQSCP